MSPRRLLAVAVVVAVGAIVAWSLVPRQPPILVLFTLDTTRADALGAYGQEPSVTPNLDRLTARGLVFERAYSTGPFTGPSHASMFTSQAPARHGVLFNGHRHEARIDSAWPTLAEHLSAQGWQTAAVVSGFPLQGKFGFARGFDSFEGLWDRTAPRESGAHGARAAERAIAVLDGPRTRPLFLWVHLFDPHLPYVWDADAADGVPFHARPVYGASAAARTPPGPLRESYLTDVHEVDRVVGEVLDALDARGLTATVAVVADHGEYLREHDLVDHSRLYEQVVRVPMAIAGPGVRPGRQPAVVSTIDLAPTLLDALDLPPLPGAAGRSLVGLDPDDDPVPAYFEWRDWHILRRPPKPGEFQVGLVRGRFKMVWDAATPTAPVLYDLEAGEEASVADRHPEEAAAMGALLRAYVAAQPDLAAAGLRFDEEDLEALRALGYVH